MNSVQTLDRFFGVEEAPSPLDAEEYSAIFSRLKPAGCPSFPARSGSHAYDVIELIAREATDAVDRSSSRMRPQENKEGFAHLLLQASIAAAKSDQRFGAADLEDVASSLFDSGPCSGPTDRIREEILRPMMIEHMTREPRTRAETVEIYAASRLATDLRDELSCHYLKMLAARLGLERAMTEQIEKAILKKR